MAIARTTGSWGSTVSDTVSVSGSGRWVFVSGQIGCDEHGKLAAEAIRSEIAHCFDRLRVSLAGAGASLDDVVRLTVYLTDLDDIEEYRRARDAAFQGCSPAAVVVEVRRLALDAHVELEALAFVSDTGTHPVSAVGADE